MEVSGLLIGIYFSCLVAFSLFSHPLSCCLFLLFGALSLCGVVYYVVGFSWYLALFCVVYIGGVYILFIFVSVCSPNVGLVMSTSLTPLLTTLSLSPLLVEISDVWFESELEEYSYYISCFGGISGYLFLCVVMLLSLSWISWISSFKDSFYR